VTVNEKFPRFLSINDLNTMKTKDSKKSSL